MTIDYKRGEFEAAALARGFEQKRLKRWGLDKSIYSDSAVNACWEGWKMAIKAGVEPLPPLPADPVVVTHRVTVNLGTLLLGTLIGFAIAGLLPA